MKYRIELEGFNDGLPYEEAAFDDKEEAVIELTVIRKTKPKVRHRLIEVINDYKSE